MARAKTAGRSHSRQVGLVGAVDCASGLCCGLLVEHHLDHFWSAHQTAELAVL